MLNRREAEQTDPRPVKYVNPQTLKLLSLKVNVVSLYFCFVSGCSTYDLICDAVLSCVLKLENIKW